MTPRFVRAVHGLRRVAYDPEFELHLADFLRSQYSRESLVELSVRFATGEGALDVCLRRAVWRGVARRLGHGVQIEEGLRRLVDWWQEQRART